MIKISSSAKINSRKIWQNLHPLKIIIAKIKHLKVLKTNSSTVVFAVVEIKYDMPHANLFLDVVTVVDYNFL